MVTKLCVGIPAYGNVPSEFVQSLIKIIALPPVGSMQLQLLAGVAELPLARNQIAAAFMKSDCSHLLFIDSDLVFTTAHIQMLFQHKVDFIGGFYPRKQEGPLQWVINTKPAPINPLGTGLQELKYIGTGFMLISRKVFESILAREEEQIWYEPDEALPNQQPGRQWDFFHCGVRFDPDTGKRRYLTEDWWFCQSWIDCGGKVFGDARVVLQHIGQITFPLKSQLPAPVIPTVEDVKAPA